jgi:hypothetical protein
VDKFCSIWIRGQRRQHASHRQSHTANARLAIHYYGGPVCQDREPGNLR